MPETGIRSGDTLMVLESEDDQNGEPVNRNVVMKVEFLSANSCSSVHAVLTKYPLPDGSYTALLQHSDAQDPQILYETWKRLAECGVPTWSWSNAVKINGMDYFCVPDLRNKYQLITSKIRGEFDGAKQLNDVQIDHDAARKKAETLQETLLKFSEANKYIVPQYPWSFGVIPEHAWCFGMNDTSFDAWIGNLDMSMLSTGAKEVCAERAASDSNQSCVIFMKLFNELLQKTTKEESVLF